MISFYHISHDHSASAYMFNYYWLVSRGDWWANAFVAGWERLRKCKGVSVTSSSTKKIISTGWHSITVSSQGPVVTENSTSMVSVSITTTTSTLPSSSGTSTSTSTSTLTSTSVFASSGGSLQHEKFYIIGMVPILILTFFIWKYLS